jgi:hypothetical protein
LSGAERDARGLVAVDHPERSSTFPTIPITPTYLKVEPIAQGAHAATHLPIVALDGRCYELARFRHPADAAFFLQRSDGARTLPEPIAKASARTKVEQRDLLLDSSIQLVTDDVASRFAAFLTDIGVDAAQAHDAIRTLRERGLGLVDPNRHRSWIDEQVFEGALYRGHGYRRRAETAEARVAELAGVMPPDDQTTGEYDQ